MFCCKLGHSIKKKILSLCYSKEPFVSVKEHAIYLDGSLTIVHTITSVSIDETIKKCKIEYPESYSYSKPLVYGILLEHTQAPWLWIGASAFWKNCDMTSSLEPYIVTGNRITIELLGKLFPLHSNWKYLDPVTLKEVEFPKDGITIQK
uniref:Uncharacterized protein n=1 Tax=viral metagenome TaxID=1070528 RepID=A0A6C0F2E8_9ZZZZ